MHLRIYAFTHSMMICIIPQLMVLLTKIHTVLFSSPPRLTASHLQPDLCAAAGERDRLTATFSHRTDLSTLLFFYMAIHLHQSILSAPQLFHSKFPYSDSPYVDLPTAITSLPRLSQYSLRIAPRRSHFTVMI